MKNLFILLCLCFSMTIVNAQSTTITTVIKDKKDGSKEITTTASQDGKTPQAQIADAETDEDVLNVISENTEIVLKKLNKSSSNVMAGPNGEGDVKVGKIPSGDFPPIIFTTGDGPNIPDYPSNSLVFYYKNMDDLKNNYKSDLHNAISKVMK